MYISQHRKKFRVISIALVCLLLRGQVGWAARTLRPLAAARAANGFENVEIASKEAAYQKALAELERLVKKANAKLTLFELRGLKRKARIADLMERQAWQALDARQKAKIKNGRNRLWAKVLPTLARKEKEEQIILICLTDNEPDIICDILIEAIKEFTEDNSNIRLRDIFIALARLTLSEPEKEKVATEAIRELINRQLYSPTELDMYFESAIQLLKPRSGEQISKIYLFAASDPEAIIRARYSVSHYLQSLIDSRAEKISLYLLKLPQTWELIGDLEDIAPLCSTIYKDALEEILFFVKQARSRTLRISNNRIIIKAVIAYLCREDWQGACRELIADAETRREFETLRKESYRIIGAIKDGVLKIEQHSNKAHSQIVELSPKTALWFLENNPNQIIVWAQESGSVYQAEFLDFLDVDSRYIKLIQQNLAAWKKAIGDGPERDTPQHENRIISAIATQA